MIHLTGHEHIPVGPNHYRRLADLPRVVVLGAANFAARDGRQEMADAWQHRLLRRVIAATQELQEAGRAEVKAGGWIRPIGEVVA